MRAAPDPTSKFDAKGPRAAPGPAKDYRDHRRLVRSEGGAGRGGATTASGRGLVPPGCQPPRHAARAQAVERA